MIRNVVMGRLRQDDPGAQQRLAKGMAGIAGLTLPGQLAVHVGRDAGLREGGWSFAITSDWADAQAYRAYDADPEHNRYRKMVVDSCSDVARVQFTIPD